MELRELGAPQSGSEPAPVTSDATSETRARVGAWLSGWRVALVLLAVLEMALALAGAAAGLVGGHEPFAGNWENLIIQGGGPAEQFLSHWQRWDALWYQHIAQSGYQAGNGSTAFFPLYPMLSRALSVVLAGNVVLAELVLSGVAFAGAMWLLWKVVARETSGATSLTPATAAWPGRAMTLPLLTVLLVALFPSGFFLLGPFTESLFLLLTLAAFWLSRTGRPWAAGLVGFFASLTRTQGILLALPLAYEQLRQRDSFRWALRRGGRRPDLALLASAGPVLGLLVFVAFQAIVLRQSWTGLNTQEAWGYQLATPWQAISASVQYIDTVPNTNSAYVEVLNLVCLLSFTVLTVAGARRLPLAYTLYALPSLGVLLFRQMYFSPLMSVSRLVLVVFPCFMVGAMWLAPRPKLAAAWLGVSLLLQLALFQYFVRWGFVA